MSTTLNSPPASGNGTLGAVLASIHDRWIERLAHVLAPAMVPRASFWDRWGATRFLTDQFEARFALQCALAESLAGVIDPMTRARLDAGRHEIDALRKRLVAAGRRRGTAGPVAMLARQLIEQTRLWCAEMETAAGHVTLDSVPEDSRELLERLRDTTELGW